MWSFLSMYFCVHLFKMPYRFYDIKRELFINLPWLIVPLVHSVRSWAIIRGVYIAKVMLPLHAYYYFVRMNVYTGLLCSVYFIYFKSVSSLNIDQNLGNCHFCQIFLSLLAYLLVLVIDNIQSVIHSNLTLHSGKNTSSNYYEIPDCCQPFISKYLPGGSTNLMTVCKC